MIDGLFLRWFVTVLFILAAAQCVYALTRVGTSRKCRIGHFFHLAMSVAMIFMAWPFSADWPTVAPMLFFIVATVWFVISIATKREDCEVDRGCVPETDTMIGRVVAIYHAAMMGAMSWMYAVMNGSMLPGSESQQHQHALASARTVLAHAGHQEGPMPAHNDSGPSYVDTVNSILGIGFLVAAAVWLYVYFGRRRSAPNAQLDSFIGDLCQIFMATGMGIMFLSII